MSTLTIFTDNRSIDSRPIRSRIDRHTQYPAKNYRSDLLPSRLDCDNSQITRLTIDSMNFYENFDNWVRSRRTMGKNKQKTR